MADKLEHMIAAIVPCSDIEASTVFYARLGLSVFADHGRYRILTDGKGWHMHLSNEGRPPQPLAGGNRYGLYLYVEDVDGLAAKIADLLPGGGPGLRPWGMYEVSVSDPDGTLVRIGWPSRLMT